MKQTDTNNRILEYLLNSKETTRVDIRKQFNLSAAAVTNITKQLIQQKILFETDKKIIHKEGAGRTQQVLKINPSYCYYIGVSFNPRGISSCICNTIGEIIFETSYKYNSADNQSINKLIISSTKSLLNKFSNLNILGLGLAIPGHYDYQKDILISNNKRWNDFHLKEIKNELEIPVIAENNVESMALSYYLFKNTKENEKFIYLLVSYGIYASFINPSNIHPKRNYTVGEVGHSIVENNGIKCECGKQGCLQTYISETWLIKRAKELFNYSKLTVLHELVEKDTDITIDTVLAAYKLNDGYIVRMLNKGIDLLSIAISNFLLIYDADTIYVDSHLLQNIELKDRLLSNIHKQLNFIYSQKATDIHILSYSENRRALGGCALVALSQFVKKPAYLERTL